MGLGEIGLPAERFWQLTFWEWSRIVAGYRKRQTEYWRMVRQVLCLTFNVNVEKKDRCEPEEFMPLPGDPDIKAKGFIPPEVFINMMQQAFGQTQN